MEGKVSVQRNRRSTMQRGLWFGERKGGVEKRPAVGSSQSKVVLGQAL